MGNESLTRKLQMLVDFFPGIDEVFFNPWRPFQQKFQEGIVGAECEYFTAVVKQTNGGTSNITKIQSYFFNGKINLKRRNLLSNDQQVLYLK